MEPEEAVLADGAARLAGCSTDMRGYVALGTCADRGDGLQALARFGDADPASRGGLIRSVIREMAIQRIPTKKMPMVTTEGQKN